MDKIESQVLPVPPNMLASLRAGFDAVANQAAILLIPITLDLILWLGPHLQVKSLVGKLINTMSTSDELASINTGEMLTVNLSMIQSAAEQLNLLGFIRTLPVGIPSIMSSRQPVEIPLGQTFFVDMINPLVVLALVIGLMLLGLLLGCAYYLFVSQAAMQGRIELKQIVISLPRAFGQVLTLTLSLLLLFLAISIPSGCAISAIALFGLPLGQFAIFLYIGVLFWLAFPLLFSAHGIFVNRNNALASVQRSMLMTRMTLPTTSLFIMIIIALSEGMDYLWRVPPETSWLTLLGISGHAFITSGLLAASFIYYRDADRWSQMILKTISSQKELPLQGR